MATQGRSQIAKDILRRVRWLYFLFLLIAAAIVGRILWIQYGPQGAELRAQSRRITFERVAVEAERGDILARDGRILATSVPTYEIRMDLAAAGLADSVFNRHVDSLAYRLSAFFGDRSQAAYRKMLTDARADRKSNRYKLISPRRINYLEEREIRQFPIFRLGPNRGGYIKVKVNRRLLPHGSLAERTIGTSNDAGVRIGIEGAFDEQLRGVDGSTMMQRVSGSFRIPVPDPMNVEPVNGLDVVTTIDIDLQDVAETALKQQLDRYNADWGTVVLMEVATGEIHAMTNLTRKAPGAFVEDFNYAIGHRMEPGSTFKLATLITLLEDAKMSLDREFDCENGRARVGRRNVVDDHPEGVISLRRIFEVSSNIGFAKAVDEVYGENPARFVDFIRRTGMGDTLGIEIPGEQPPLIKHPSDGLPSWDGTSLVMMSYGYALELTPMHTLALYNAVANGGKLVRPRLVREIRNYGETVRRFGTETINPAICSKPTLRLVRECLEAVVDEGTGRVLKNPYYEVAAKTGTAQIVMESGGYTDSRGGRNYLATMVGYFPADNPKYSCIVAIKTYYGRGNYNTYYGASLAGPVFRAIADRVYASNTAWHDPVDRSGEKTLPGPESIKNGLTQGLRLISNKLTLSFRIARGDDGWLYVQTPAVTAAAEAGGEEAEAAPPYLTVANDSDTIPSVKGMGLREAMYLLESKGLRVTYSGKGRVTGQSVAEGTRAVRGQTVHLTLAI
ncbi:MAG: transpeptidase family protein [Alistipes sp.]|nr:transpeptidase family protein [Alistipes sp.]